jgi:hypothetical protein
LEHNGTKQVYIPPTRIFHKNNVGVTESVIDHTDKKKEL